MPKTPGSPPRDDTGKFIYPPADVQYTGMDIDEAGAHLYYTVHTNNLQVDPTKFITGMGTTSTTSWTWTDPALNTGAAEKIAALENEVQELKEQLEAQNAELDAMTEDLDAIREELVETHNNLADRTIDVSSLEEDLSTAEKDRDTAIARVAELEDSLRDITKIINSTI